MRTQPASVIFLLVIAQLASQSMAQTPLLGTISYQGRLTSGGVPVNGTADISVRLWDSQSGGIPLAFIINYPGKSVIDGLFTITPNFGGNVFNGDVRWMEVTVNGVPLVPRQMITSTPYALQTRGMFYNETEDFVGIGRESQVTVNEVFGVYRPVAGYGGMFIETDAGGKPFYGYSTDGAVDAFHFFDGFDNQWKLVVKANQAMTVSEEGYVGIGEADPSHPLHVVGTKVSLVQVENDQISGSSIVAFADGSSGVAINGVANGVNSKAVRGIANGAGAYAGYFEGDTHVQGFLGVGQSNTLPSTQLHVRDSINSTATPSNHVALIENSNTGTSPDVLALKVNSSDLSPGGAINFISFFNDNDDNLGSIQGNNAGSIELGGAGADYAEWMAHLVENDSFEPGDVVGVFGGRISKTTDGADQIMVISTQPIVVGNRPREDDEGLPGWEKVAFIGQAPVRVRGPVSSGDFLIPSGMNDGTATAIAPDAVTPGQLSKVIATAWESTFSESVNLVNAAIGIDQAAASARVIESLRSRQLRHQREMESMQRDLAEVKAALQRLLETEGFLR